MKFQHDSVSTPAADQGEPACSVRQWDAVDGTERATISPELVEELRAAAIRGFVAIPKRGLEIGGLLLGEFRPNGGPGDFEPDVFKPDVFEIAAAEDVPCEHRFGPSYTLDEHDRANLVELLARYEGAGHPHVVGFYRSYTGRDAKWDDADEELLRTFFSRHRSFVCVMLRPLSVEKCTADVRFWRGDGIVNEPAVPLLEAVQETAVQERAVRETMLPASATVRAEPPPETADAKEGGVHEVQSERRLPTPVLPVPLHPRFTEQEDAVPEVIRRSRILLPLVLCLLAAIASGAIYQLWTVTREPRWASIRFDARPSVGALLLTWDTSTPPVTGATRGTLVVTDAGNTEEIPLSQEQIRRGNFAYTRSNGDALFRLRLYNKDVPVVAESLRVIKLASPSAASSPAGAATGAVAAEIGTTANPLAEREGAVALNSTPSTGLRPADSSPAEPAPSPAVKPPEVRQQVLPVISAGIRARILSLTVVPVTVHVNGSGHVTRASSNVAGHGIERYLADEAVRAARQWVFWPARSRKGRPVAATKIISFAFAPAAH